MVLLPMRSAILTISAHIGSAILPILARPLVEEGHRCVATPSTASAARTRHRLKNGMSHLNLAVLRSVVHSGSSGWLSSVWDQPLAGEPVHMEKRGRCCWPTPRQTAGQSRRWPAPSHSPLQHPGMAPWCASRGGSCPGASPSPGAGHIHSQHTCQIKSKNEATQGHA